MEAAPQTAVPPAPALVAQWCETARRLFCTERSLRRALADQATAHGLSDVQLLLLWTCATGPDEGVAQHALSQPLGMSRAQACQILDQLRRRGLLDSHRAGEDRRRQFWRLTAAGRAAIDASMPGLVRWAAELEEKVPGDRQEALNEALVRLTSVRPSAPALIRSVARAAMWLFCAALALGGGCSRAYYRHQADTDAYAAVEEKSCDPRWPLEDYTIHVDPRSRMFNPFNPDCPPMPPDDPAAHKLMHCVDGKRGWPHWHDCGDTDQVDNPSWIDAMPRDDEGKIVLDLPAAVRTATLNSPQYQSELEDVYLSALDVTFERFRFDVQFFGGYQAQFTADGPLRSPAGSSSELELSTFPAGRDIQARRLFATGGELVVGLANSLVWQFSGPNSDTATTLLDFSLVQPLLRGAGRDVVLERLTIAERTLLANVRQMERYRQAFATDVATGRDVGQGPQRRGGFFGGAGLEGFSGVGGGGFGRVGGITGQGPGGDVGVAGGAGAARAGGYLGILQSQQEIRNLQQNVASLRDSLERLQLATEAPTIEPQARIGRRFQLELAKQALHNAESRLLTAQSDYASNLDRFKIRLGLPPDVDVVIRDTLLEQFELIDPELTGLQSSADTVILRLQPPPDQKPTYRENVAALIDELNRYEQALTGASRTHAQAVQKLATVHTAVRAIDAAANRRRELLERLSQNEEVRANRVAGEVLSVKAFDRRLAFLTAAVAELDKNVAEADVETTALLTELTALHTKLEAELAALAPDAPGDIDALVATRQQWFSRLTTRIRRLSDDIADMWLVQAKARLESITLAPIDLDATTAMSVAETNRLDWMNARANLVDAWRLIQFNADALQSELNLVFSGDMSNVGDNPVKFDAATGRLRVGVQFDAPLTRLAERNRYRQAQIEYDQARRNYYQFVDRINQSLRFTLRSIELNDVNFELRRAAVEVALSQVDLAREQLLAPVPPGATTQPGDVGRDLVSALSDLATVQNDFLSVWLNERVQRMSLDLDLGTMRWDAEGNWIEPDAYDSETLLQGCPDTWRGLKPTLPSDAGPPDSRHPEASEGLKLGDTVDAPAPPD